MEAELLEQAPTRVIELIQLSDRDFDWALRDVTNAHWDWRKDVEVTQENRRRWEAEWTFFTHPAVVTRTIKALANIESELLKEHPPTASRIRPGVGEIPWEAHSRQFEDVKRFAKRAKDASGLTFHRRESVRQNLVTLDTVVSRYEQMIRDMAKAIAAHRDAVTAELAPDEAPEPYEEALWAVLEHDYAPEGGNKERTIPIQVEFIERGQRRR